MVIVLCESWVKTNFVFLLGAHTCFGFRFFGLSIICNWFSLQPRRRRCAAARIHPRFNYLHSNTSIVGKIPTHVPLPRENVNSETIFGRSTKQTAVKINNVITASHTDTDTHGLGHRGKLVIELGSERTGETKTIGQLIVCLFLWLLFIWRARACNEAHKLHCPKPN